MNQPTYDPCRLFPDYHHSHRDTCTSHRPPRLRQPDLRRPRHFVRGDRGGRLRLHSARYRGAHRRVVAAFCPHPGHRRCDSLGPPCRLPLGTGRRRRNARRSDKAARKAVRPDGEDGHTGACTAVREVALGEPDCQLVWLYLSSRRWRGAAAEPWDLARSVHFVSACSLAIKDSTSL